MVHYDKGGWIVRESTAADVVQVADRMRAVDKDEVRLASGATPRGALEAGLVHAHPCLTAEHQGLAVAMFGVCPMADMPKHAIIWMLGTEDLGGLRKGLVKLTKHFIAQFLKDYEVLFNCVWSENHRAIFLLDHCGAAINPKPYRFKSGAYFNYFSFGRA